MASTGQKTARSVNDDFQSMGAAVPSRSKLDLGLAVYKEAARFLRPHIQIA